MIDKRTANLINWLEGLYPQKIELSLLNNDASFRKYYRFTHNLHTWIAVDSPPTHEKNQEFIEIQNIFNSNNVRVPKIIHRNLEDGFLILEDLGNQTLLPLLLNLQESYSDPYLLYKKCLDELIKIQLATKKATNSALKLPKYDNKLLTVEMELFIEWFLRKYLNFKLNESEAQSLGDLFHLLIDNANAQPQVIVHRDFHSRNLMLLESQQESQQVAVIDFQDAVLGPVTYDLASLFRDCYIAWPLETVKLWTEKYFNQIKANKIIDEQITIEQFWTWFLQMSLQRNLKAIGIFARLFLRDNKSGYLKDIPRTLDYAIEITSLINNTTFASVHNLLATKIIHALNTKNTSKAFLCD